MRMCLKFVIGGQKSQWPLTSQECQSICKLLIIKIVKKVVKVCVTIYVGF